MSASDLKSRDFQKILLIKLSALGDVVQTLPVLNALRTRYPKARIDWLIAGEFAELVAGHPAIGNVIVFTRAMVGALARGALCQRRAAHRQAARVRIRSGDRLARPVAQRRVRLCLRRSGADRL